MKCKFLAIGAALLFFGLLAVPATASEEKTTIECSFVDVGGKISKEKVVLSEKNLEKLEGLITKFINALQVAKSTEEVSQAISTFCTGCHHLGLLKHFIFIRPLAYFRFVPCCSFVVSKGYGYRFLPFKYSNFRIYKPLTIWHYTNKYRLGALCPSKTVIVRWLPFHVKTLTGVQLGFMTNFFGIYIYIAKPLPKKSFTFFMGFARHATGVEVPFAPFW